MKKIIILGICLTVLMVAGINSAEASYLIEGNVSDWGIDLTAPEALYIHYLDTHIPTGPTVNVVTEDNADITKNPLDTAGWWWVGPNASSGNQYDAEAIYFDNDEQYAYIAVITGLSNGTEYYKPGDIAIDIDSDNFYEYGISILDGKLYSVISWTNGIDRGAPYDYNPYKINDKSDPKGTSDGVQFVYTTSAVNSHYVLEARVPLSLLEDSANPGNTISDIGIHWSMECNNDYLNLKADLNPVPEPASLLLLGLGLAGIAGRKLRRQK